MSAAVEALAAANGEGKLLAGGQSLLPLLNFRMVRPSIIIDLNGLKELSFIELRGGNVVIGALARHREIEQSHVIASELPVMSAAMRHVAHLAIRNRGTIGGSLAHADPAAELPMLALFYEATIVAQGKSGRRKIPAEAFFVDALTNSLKPDEIIVEIEFPIMQQDGWAFEEAARRFGDFALASIAVSLNVSSTIEGARVAAMGVADTPVRLRTVEDRLVGVDVNDELSQRFSELVMSSVSPNSDLHASAQYRRHLLGVLATRAITTALRRKG
ncbi:MAG: xanthine dehydrogenase family protein subunit M [Bradyrhizobium sp.]|nr:xanthine dehydrogenase family protein subunit M [Bradyrhizobium sp.]